MKKLFNTSLFYFVLASVFGVFYREFTKFEGFSDHTTLSLIHTHLFALGMIVFFIILLMNYVNKNFIKSKYFDKFYITYNVGLLTMVSCLLVRGINEVKNISLSNGTDHMISGIAGIGHILLTVGLVFLFLNIKQIFVDNK